MAIRVRFAPSPTGVPHIGNTRTALFNFLFSKQHKGKFILRIEDTDQERLIPESLPKILEILRVVGIQWDEGPEVGGSYKPYVQSKRLKIYKEYALKLWKQGKVYPCFCLPADLKKMREVQKKQGKIPRYDRRCLKLSKKEVEERIKSGEKFCLRLKIPGKGRITWQDLIQNQVSFDVRALDDQVLLKSDGYPTYHLAVVVDDHVMKITHILRGAEWISSTPKHILLYQAFGWKPPQIGHFPVILGPDKKKLSKRHGVKSVLDYQKEGYLPEALVNFMVFLGWSYKDNSDILSIKDLIKLFDLKRVRKVNPIFDKQKLDWFNGQHLRRKSDKELLDLLQDFIPAGADKVLIKQIIPLIRERLVKLSDFTGLTEFFFKEVDYDKKLLSELADKDLVKEQLETTTQTLAKLDNWTVKKIEAVLRGLASEKKWQTSQFFMGLRVAVTGKKVTPPLFESMKILGKEKTCRNLRKALEKI